MTEGAIEPPPEEEESKGAPSDEGTDSPKEEELRDKAVATTAMLPPPPPPPPQPERPTMTGGAVRPCDGASSAAEDEEVYDDRAAESPSTTAVEAVGAPEVAAKAEKGVDGSGTTAAAAATTSTSVAADMPPSPAIVVGQTRCRDAAGYVGTIYFDGRIPTSSNSSGSSSATTNTTNVKARHYYGVVWDDPTRGRHDGSAVDPTTKRLVRYMKVSPADHEHGSHPTASSFVVPSKLDLGKPLSFELLLERYVRKHRPGDGEDPVVLCAGSRHDKDVKTKPIELVGMEKIVSQQQLESLSTVSMRFMGIHHVPEMIFSVEEEAGECDDAADNSQALLSRRLKRCTHVDLAGNLLTDWDDLRRLLTVLPDLQNVSVAHNRFVDATMQWSSSNSHRAWSDQLVRLNIGKCNLRTSRTLVDLCLALPSLESLCCAHADLRDLDAVVRERSTTRSGDDDEMGGAATTTGFANVAELDVTSCQLTTALLRSLSTLFPGVTTLNLTNNGVESWPEDPVFRQLTHLQWTLSSPHEQASSSADTAHTEVSRHSDLMQMCLKHLVEAYHDQLISLRIELTHPGSTSSSSLSSFVGSSPSVVPAPCKLLLIACLGRLQLWNASHISNQERKDAEIYLLRHVDRDGYPTQPGGAAAGTRDASSTPRLLIKCPRYDELVARHPNALQPAYSLGGNGTPGALMNLVTVEFRSLCPHSCDRPPVIRKLPVTLTLGRLKSMLARHFDLDADLQALSWVVASEPASSASRTAGRRPDQALPTPLNEHDDSTLEQCGLVHGAIVFMNEREISPREKENHHRAMLERKIEQQEHDMAEFERRKRALAGGAV